MWRENKYARKNADVLVKSKDVSLKNFNKNELKNILTKFHDFIINLKYLALNNLTIKITISHEYLIQNVLKSKVDEKIKLAANHWLICLDGRTGIGTKGVFFLQQSFQIFLVRVYKYCGMNLFRKCYKYICFVHFIVKLWLKTVLLFI